MTNTASPFNKQSLAVYDGEDRRRGWFLPSNDGEVWRSHIGCPRLSHGPRLSRYCSVNREIGSTGAKLQQEIEEVGGGLSMWIRDLYWTAFRSSAISSLICYRISQHLVKVAQVRRGHSLWVCAWTSRRHGIVALVSIPKSAGLPGRLTRLKHTRGAP